MEYKILTAHGSITQTKCDILVMKYDQVLYGANSSVAKALGLTKANLHMPPGDHLILPTKGKMPFKHILFIGVPSPSTFDYSEIRKFAKQALEIISISNINHKQVAMTMLAQPSTLYGIGYGLDEREAFMAQIAGILEYYSQPFSGVPPERIIIVEQEANRFSRISEILDQVLQGSTHALSIPRLAKSEQPIPDAGIMSDSKRLVFVAMPYNEQMEDVFEFGIREPVNNVGCLCERCDREAFTGDVLERIKNRITKADVVIADMTGSNPNVYLEVGYAWGKGVQTLLIAKDGEDLKFDVKTHKCIYYKSINHLRKQLTDFIKRLMDNA